ncbi:hypothetical protein NK6_1712 [Bradyrhizobium diazoefficiens]|jgi:hypothetical protein|uniref:Uncharacterized protein n=1 Tax=Bradyrhizobium diazoefficiens TaxID=1355477 RepID=A0A0E4BL30_9BRAD|nr:hypothetical protein NK6_1712 [Bradyrhizobium diazoefficiens]
MVVAGSLMRFVKPAEEGLPPFAARLADHLLWRTDPGHDAIIHEADAGSGTA